MRTFGEKVRQADAMTRALIPNMVSEIIRWQTPLAHMRRLAKEDVKLGGQTIKAGDKVVMWYVSGNRDDSVFENPDRPHHRPAQCPAAPVVRFTAYTGVMGNRLGEMQLKILWEEIQKRFRFVK